VGVAVDFDAFVAARGPALLRLAYVLTGDNHRAEDLLQTALAKAYRRWDVVGQADNPEGYVRRVLVNAHTSWWRARRNRELPTGESLDVATPDVGEAVTVREALWAELRALPLRQRTAVVLRYYEGLDDAEISAYLDCAPATVRSLVSRGLATLRARALRPDETQGVQP
jgi:RNA polymerase sigma-70 factor (sigma-E family)